MAMLNTNRLAEIEARAVAATESNQDMLLGILQNGPGGYGGDGVYVRDLCQDIPDLIAALRAAQARVAALEAVVQVVEDHALNLDIIKGLLVGIRSPLGPLVIQDILDALATANEQDQEPVPDTDEVDLPC